MAVDLAIAWVLWVVLRWPILFYTYYTPTPKPMPSQRVHSFWRQQRELRVIRPKPVRGSVRYVRSPMT
jgi:hypothetical protein